MSKDAKKKKKTRKPKPYTTGELNKLIDSLIHPLSKTDERFIFVDGLLHGLVEKDPPKSIRKFMKYNLPKLIKQLKKKAKEKDKAKEKAEDKDEGEC